MEFILLDLSFIPKSIFPKVLLEYQGEEAVMPYTKEKIEYHVDDHPLLIREIAAVNRYMDFEYDITEFALERLKIGDALISEKCLRYLLELGAIQFDIFDPLLDIYIFHRDTQSVQWLKERLQNAMESPYKNEYSNKSYQASLNRILKFERKFIQ